jgi:hypothetical protein
VPAVGARGSEPADSKKNAPCEGRELHTAPQKSFSSDALEAALGSIGLSCQGCKRGEERL